MVIMDKCKFRANGSYGQKYMSGKWLIIDKCKCRANGSYGQM